MAEKLKIYACSGISDAAQEKITYDYWLDNINPIFNTQAVNALNVDINLLVTELNYLDLTKQEKIEHLNTIDLATLCLFYAQEYAKDNSTLEMAGRAIGKVLADKAFDFQSLNNAERDAHLDELFERVASVIENDENKSWNTEFETWWSKNVMELNKIGLTEQQQQIKFTPISGIGVADDALNDPTIGDYLQKGATFFMYTYFTNEQLRKLPKIFSDRKKYQVRTYNFCKDVFMRLYGGEEQMQSIIRAGIIQKYKAYPEVICADIAAGGRKYDINGIGVPALAPAHMIGAVTVAQFITILTAVLTFLATVITAIIAYCTRVKEVEAGTIDRATIDTGSPQTSDFDSFISNITKSSTILPILAVAAGIYLFVETNN